ncbi:hypothetical protein Y1Q_0007243 [Alligator mississippiensis]|uniref:Protein ripply1 n=1 Tax=Alligator mississippiensis TaxID=8496 RepID=A0A151NN94_ALLMI|nr:hypothetical protein Y1Q_0007243 [Alligator mississippiensis]
MDIAYGGEVMGDDDPSKALALFRHPVRLFWPKSKSFDYLYSEGEKLLENFPVQATINLYEDSDSEDEEEEEEYGGDEGGRRGFAPSLSGWRRLRFWGELPVGRAAGHEVGDCPECLREAAWQWTLLH